MENRNPLPKKYFIINWKTRFLFLFFSGFFLCFPISIDIYNPQEKLVAFFSPLIRWTGIHIFSLDKPFTAELLSDSTGLYIFSFLLLLFSFIFGWIWTKYGTSDYRKLKYILIVFLSYYLSLVLFIYGTNKLFKVQFYLPEPNTLFTPLGYLSKDILFWSTIGSSYSYNIIMGLAQIIPASLLLFRRTRIIGAAAGVILFINIVIINFTYDISVKVFSSFLLCISIYIALPLFKTIFLQFYKGIPYHYPEWYPKWKNNRQILFYSISKTLLIGAILFYSFFTYFKSGIFNGDNAPKSRLFGAYLVTIPSRNEKTSSVKRFFFHSKDYFIIQNENDELTDYKITDMDNYRLVVQDYDKINYFLHYTFSADSLTISGKLESDSLNVTGIKINLKTLPLLQNSFIFP